MRDCARLRGIQALLEVQRVRRAGACGAMTAAREAEAAAQAAAADAHERTEDAGRSWDEHVTGAGFDPCYGRWLADQLVSRASAQSEADEKAVLAGQLADRRQREWRSLEAQVRANEENAARLATRVERAREEQRLGQLADRVTYQWVKP